MKNRSIKQGLEVYEGLGNVFEDLNIPDAAEHEIKAQVAFKLNDAIASLHCSQGEVAKKLGIKQPHVSQIVNYNLQGFSVERLLHFLVRLGHSVTIRIADDSEAEACLSVVSVPASSIEASAAMNEVVSQLSAYWDDSFESNHFASVPPSVPTVRLLDERDYLIPDQPIERRTVEFAYSGGKTLQ